MSGETFSVPDDTDVVHAIRRYISAGLDADSGIVEYDVDTDDGRNFCGTVRVTSESELG